MTDYKVQKTIATSYNPAVQDYKTNPPRFNSEASGSSSAFTLRPGGYSLFVSDKGDRAGSYSLTSLQEAYLALNMSFLPKGSRRSNS